MLVWHLLYIHLFFAGSLVTTMLIMKHLFFGQQRLDIAGSVAFNEDPGDTWMFNILHSQRDFNE